jgi:hypothetical protein
MLKPQYMSPVTGGFSFFVVTPQVTRVHLTPCFVSCCWQFWGKYLGTTETSENFIYEESKEQI